MKYTMKEKTEKKIHFAEKSAENASLHFMRPLMIKRLKFWYENLQNMFPNGINLYLLMWKLSVVNKKHQHILIKKIILATLNFLAHKIYIYRSTEFGTE